MSKQTPFSVGGGRLTLVLILALTFSACSNNKPATIESDKASNGHIDSITVYCDEAFQYLMGEEIEIYERVQPDQHLDRHQLRRQRQPEPLYVGSRLEIHPDG